MKSKSVLLFLIGIFSLFVLSIDAKDITCTIKGKVKESDSKEIILFKGTDDYRTSSIYIPIINGSFEYKLTVPISEVYALAFPIDIDKLRPLLFFPEQGEVKVTVYPITKLGKSRVEGGLLNKQLNEYQYPYNNYTGQIQTFGAEADAHINQGKGDTPELKAIFDKAFPIGKQRNLFEKQYFKKEFANQNPSLTSYFVFTRELMMFGISPNDSTDIKFSVFSKRFPDHPYTQLVYNRLVSLKGMEKGGKYVDFTASDINGKLIKVSELFKDEYTLLDLWSTWCAPCIKKGRDMVPVYNEYKDKGFNVIGVVREAKRAGATEKALDRENYPWLDLILALDDPNDTWTKYNLSFSGGGTFLFNKNKEIIAVNPTVEEVQQLLKKELGK